MKLMLRLFIPLPRTQLLSKNFLSPLPSFSFLFTLYFPLPLVKQQAMQEAGVGV